MQSFLFTLFIALSFWIKAQDLTTFILVRHAEKVNDGTKDPSLSSVGKERAENLATLLESQEVEALYATPFKRTMETLQPLAQLKSLKIQSYDPFAKKEWLTRLASQHTGGTIVLVGHSNTIPVLANFLLGSEQFTQFEENEYSDLIVIVADEVGNGKLVRLKF